jgi:aspartate carbamoyltransferase catalytic subunit
MAMGFLGKSLISLDDFTLAEIDHLLLTAQRMKNNRQDFAHVCDGKILATLFFEPSTRTKLSFESAMLRMGGSVLGFGDPGSSSTAKGESLADTIRVISSYADVAVIRHPKEGSAKLAAEYATIPIVNGGDGGHQHPTQTLTDLLTILETKGSLHGHRIAFCGDLRFGRTVHSLISMLARYQISEFVLISPLELELPSTLQRRLLEKGVVLHKHRQLEEVIGDVDILYMTRIQRERFFSEAEYQRLKDAYLLDATKLRLAKPDLRVLHPLPRVNEISSEVDSDPRAIYFQQAALGVYVRMALLALQLGVIE